MGLLASLGMAKPREARKTEMVHLGEGLMPLPRRMVERIQLGEYVEFADFPIMDGGARAMDQAEQDLGDRILVVQAPDRRRSRREVPDASMWGSCFTLFERAVLMADPARGPELSAYRETVQKAARTHQWDFVLRYDRQFRKAAAGDKSRSWARVDSSLFMQELAGPQAAYLASGVRVSSGGPDGAASRKRSREAGPGGDPGGTREAWRVRNCQESVTNSTSGTGYASLAPDASLGMHVRSAEGATPGPGAAPPRWNGEGGTRAGVVQDLVWANQLCRRTRRKS